MRRARFSMAIRSFVLLVALSVATTGFGQERPRRHRPPVERTAWTHAFDHAIAFQLLVDSGLLVVGTARHLYGVDPRTGREMWRKRDLTIEPEDVLTVPGTDLLLLNDDEGGKFSDKETSVLAIDRETGRDVWESKLVKGKGLHVVADQPSALLVLVTVKEPHGEGRDLERKPRLNVLDLASGKRLWDTELDSLVMRPSLDAEISRGDKKQRERSFDLGNFQLPVVAGGQLFVTYRGIACYDARTGKKLWRHEYGVREGDLALSDAEPIVDERVVYTSGEGRVRAFDRETGKKLWTSDDFGVVPELFVDERAIYGRLGGRFYDVDDEAWRWKGPYGAVAIDRASGKRIWRYGGGNDSITNLSIAGDRVWLGDEEHLVGLDRATGERRIDARHRLEVRPVFAALNENDQVVLVSDEEAAGYAAATGERVWYERHGPIGPSGWRRFAAGLLMTSGAVLSVASYAAAKVKGLGPAVPSPAIRITGLQPIVLFNTRGFAIRTGSRTGRSLWRAGEGMLGVTRFAHLTGSHQYFITKLEGADQALAGVNLTTGETDHAVSLPSKTPNLAIDEANGLVFQVRGKELVALGL
jgi:outer membrane protein assembly factor BamB